LSRPDLIRASSFPDRRVAPGVDKSPPGDDQSPPGDDMITTRRRPERIVG
jgi:hypothetical protein